MSKQKKKKDNFKHSMEELMIQQYLKNLSRTQEKAYDISSSFSLGQMNQSEHMGNIEDVMAEQRIANYVIEKVMERITPYIAEQWNKNKHDKKQQKSMLKRIKKLEDRISELEYEQKGLCQALTYLLAIAIDIPTSKLSASDLEKAYKEIYKKQRKAKKHSWRESNEMPLLPMEIY